MGALWIAHVHVTDEEAYGKYAASRQRRSPRMAGSFWRAAVAMCNWKATTGRAMWSHASPAWRTRWRAITRPRYQEALSFAKGASERDLMVVEEV